MIKVQILILLATLSITLSAFGADWSVGWTGADEKHQYQKITDEQEFQFTMAKFHCKVSKIALDKVYNEIFERRYLSCSISKDTTVSIDLSYNVRSKDYVDAHSLFIDNNGKTSIATLTVIQKRE
jgi:3'-phosphoadenosine 5'-phosphosulfate sulfotransferase (PAPS reductase)/FAD synthetase